MIVVFTVVFWLEILIPALEGFQTCVNASNEGFIFNRRTFSQESLDELTVCVRLVVRKLTDGLLTKLFALDLSKYKYIYLRILQTKLCQLVDLV